MKQFHEAMRMFWSGFQNRSSRLPETVPLAAYPSGHAEARDTDRGGSTAQLPYITYEIACPGFGESIVLTGKVWTRGDSWGLVEDVLSQAGERVPEGGLRLSLGENGSLALYRGLPFCEYLSAENGDIRNKAGLIRLLVKSYGI